MIMSQQQRRNPFGPGGQLPSPRGSTLPSPHGDGGFIIANPYGTPGSRLSVASSTGSSRGNSPTPSDVSTGSLVPGRANPGKGGIHATIQQIKGKASTLFPIFTFGLMCQEGCQGACGCVVV